MFEVSPFIIHPLFYYILNDDCIKIYTIKSIEISTVVHDGQQYITEEQLYNFVLEARTNSSKRTVYY